MDRSPHDRAQTDGKIVEGYLLTPNDPALAEEMKLGERFMKEYRDDFKALAK